MFQLKQLALSSKGEREDEISEAERPLLYLEKRSASGPLTPHDSWYHTTLLKQLMFIAIFKSIISCSYQAIEQSPCKNEPTQTPKHIAQPQITERPVEVCARFSICLERKQQQRHYKRSQQIEYEACVRLET